MSPPNHYISRSKTVNETISLIADFRDFVQIGETASAWTVSIEVFTGLDNDPDNMFYQGLSIQGVVLEQRFRLGIPGVIYSIRFTLTVNTGNVYDITTRLAVLPDLTGATPVFNVLYLTSALYPYYFSDNMSSGVTFLSGKLLGIKYFESLSSSIEFASGILIGGFIQYPVPPENLIGNISWVSGLIGGTIKNYANPPESLTSGVAWLIGDIGGTVISYAIPTDGMNSNISWYSGSLI
jgi:hypothetical protein